MRKKDDLWPKLIFPIFLIIAFSVIYLFGPSMTGFYIYDAPDVSSNLVLVAGLIFVFVLIFVALMEIMIKLR